MRHERVSSPEKETNTEWAINPEKVKRENEIETESPGCGQFEDQGSPCVSDIVYSSPGGNDNSPCESPVRQYRYITNQNQVYLNKTSPIISPGKLK